MEAIRNELQKDSDAFEQEEKKLIIKGFFKIRPSDSKFTLKIKGDFNSNNIYGISRAMIMSKSINKKIVELDMSAIESIDMQAMALLIINLKTLKESGIKTKVIGLDEVKLKLANELGMHLITQIN